MRTTIQRGGNGVVLPIPRRLAEQIGLEEGSEVEITTGGAGCLVVRLAAGPVFDLVDLLAQLTPANLHREVDTGPATGSEVW